MGGRKEGVDVVGGFAKTIRQTKLDVTLWYFAFKHVIRTNITNKTIIKPVVFGIPMHIPAHTWTRCAASRVYFNMV